MPADRVEVNYELLSAVGRGFQEAAQRLEHLYSDVTACAEELYDRNWSGDNADAFIVDLADDTLPGLERLIRALLASEEAVVTIQSIMAAGEDEAAAIFRGEAYSPSGFGGGSSSGGGASGGGSGWGEWLQIGAETVVSVLWEPADWFFTARDVLQGDYWAAVGLIPFVPSRAGKVLRKLFGSSDEVSTIVRRADDVPIAAGRGVDSAGRMRRIHNSEYRASRQEVLRNAINDPSLPSYKRGWYQQELNRLESLQRRVDAGFNPRRPQFLENLSPEQIREIQELRAYRARLRGTRPPTNIQYNTRDLRIDPNSDMGHINNQLTLDQINRPENLRIEDRGLNRSRGARFGR